MATLRGSLDSSHSPVVTFAVSAPAGPPTFFDAVIDTGFTGFVQLPESRAQELGLTPRTTSETQYPDGRIDTIPLAGPESPWVPRFKRGSFISSAGETRLSSASSSSESFGKLWSSQSLRAQSF